MAHKNFYASLILLSLLSASASGQINKKDYQAHLNRAHELFVSGQYAAACQEFKRSKELLPISNQSLREQIDYYLCESAVECENSNVVEISEKFLIDYPQSLFQNDVKKILADALFETKNYKMALENYIQIDKRRITPLKKQDMNFKVGYCYLTANDKVNAASELKQVSKQSKFYPAANYYLAYIDYVEERYDVALKGFRALEKDADFGAVVPYYILQIEYNLGNYQIVISDGPSLFEKSSPVRKAEICRIVAESHFHEKNYVQSLDYIYKFEQFAKTLSKSELYLKGYSHYMLGDWAEAEAALVQIASMQDAVGQNAAYHLAGAYLKLNDKKRASMAFSLAAQPTFNKEICEDAKFHYAKLLYELGGDKFNETINAFNDYITNYPKSKRLGEAREYLLSAYFNSRNYDAALKAISYIDNPDNNVKTALQKISYHRALEHYMNGDNAKALEYFDSSLKNQYNPKYTALSKFWKAETLYRTNQQNEAIPDYKEYIVLSNKSQREYAPAHYNLAYCYFNQQKWSDAKAYFEKFIALYTNNDQMKSDSYNRLADVDFANREYWKAIENYDKSIKLDTELSQYAEFQRAIMLGLVDRKERKIESLKNIINKRKSDYVDDAMCELGITYVKSDRFKEGAETLKELIKRYPSSPFVLNALAELGLTYQNMGQDNESLNYYKQVVSKYPTSAEAKDALLGIRNIYVDRNDIDAYVKYAAECGIETNITVTEKDSLTYTSAERVYLSGDHERATKLFRGYISSFPKGAYLSSARYFTADAYQKLKKMDEALEQYEALCELPVNNFTERGLKMAADMNFELKNYAKSAGYYKRLANISTDKELINMAFAAYLKSVVAQGNEEEILKTAKEVKSSVFISESTLMQANFALANVYAKHNDNDEAIKYYRMVSSNVKMRDGAEAKFRIISMLYDQNKLDEAEKEILDFSEQNSPFQYWIGKSFLVLGDIYVKKGDNFQAKATYQSIVDGYSDKNDGIIENAVNKLKAIKNDKQ